MTSSKRQGFGLYGDFADGELDWGDKYNENWNRLSHLVHGSLNTATLQTAEPAQNLRVPGAAFLMDVAGALPSQFRQFANQIIVWDDGKWNGYPFFAGLIVHAKDTNGLYLYSGTAWSQFYTQPAWFKNTVNTSYPARIHNNPWIFLRSNIVPSGTITSSVPTPFVGGSCTIPGLYQINAQITFNVPDSTTAQIISAYLNLEGTGGRRLATKETLIQNESTNESLSLSALVPLVEGNSISAHLAWQSGNINIIGGFGFTTLDILKVG